MASRSDNQVLRVQKESKMFEFQHRLPKLPLPDLPTTMQGYLRIAESILTKEELNRARNNVYEFMRPGGVGAKLQKFLEFRDSVCRNRQDYPHCTWLESWWEELAYLSVRSSIAIFVNYFGVLFGGKPHTNVLPRAAAIVRGLVHVKTLIDRDEFTPDYLGRNGAMPMCMHQYSRSFGTCRVPGDRTDSLVAHPHSRHIAVSCRDRWYRVDIIDDSGASATAAEICEVLQNILLITPMPSHSGGSSSHSELPRSVEEDESYRQPQYTFDSMPMPSSQMAVLTALPRARWSEVRARMLRNPVNAKSLHSIESALFVIVLSDARPNNPTETIKLCQEGEGDIWFDKVFTMIFFANGVVGFNGEHAAADAPVPNRILLDAVTTGFARMNDDAETVIRVHPDGTKGLSKPQLLKWDVDEKLALIQAAAATFYQQMCKENVITTLHYKRLGSNFCKKVGIRADSFVQMALVLAFYRDQKRITATYETATMRGYFHGRSENIRSMSIEARVFVEQFDHGDNTPAQKYELLRNAADAHEKYTRVAMAGKGVDRHILGLRMAAVELGEAMPQVFTDETFAKINNYELSTSQMIYYEPNYPGFGAPSPTAYGVCYCCRLENEMTFTVTSRASCAEKDAVRFSQAINKAMDDIADVCESGALAVAKDSLRSKI